MQKVNIVICLGTTCHLMGSSSLQTLQDDLPSALRDKVEITAKRCLGYCNSNHTKAPFIVINDEVIFDATLPKIIEKVEIALEEQ